MDKTMRGSVSRNQAAYDLAMLCVDLRRSTLSGSDHEAYLMIAFVSRGLAADAEALDQFLVARIVNLLDVVEKRAARLH